MILPLQKSRAVFLDKDGTLIKNIPYNIDPNKIELSPGAEEALPALQAAGYRIVIISNQDGVAHGYFSENALEDVRLRLSELLARLGVSMAGFYACLHHPQARVAAYRQVCSCRKPAAGML